MGDFEEVPRTQLRIAKAKLLALVEYWPEFASVGLSAVISEDSPNAYYLKVNLLRPRPEAEPVPVLIDGFRIEYEVVGPAVAIENNGPVVSVDG